MSVGAVSITFFFPSNVGSGDGGSGGSGGGSGKVHVG